MFRYVDTELIAEFGGIECQERLVENAGGDNKLGDRFGVFLPEGISPGERVGIVAAILFGDAWKERPPDLLDGMGRRIIRVKLISARRMWPAWSWATASALSYDARLGRGFKKWPDTRGSCSPRQSCCC
jgi:hypothetical protein